MAFTHFAENHQASIKRGYWIDKSGSQYPICLETVLKAVYPRTHCMLLEYVQSRTEAFKLANSEQEECKIDKDSINNLNKLECVS